MPVYGLAQPLFEPVHDRIRQRPLMLRAALYSAGILAVEYTSGRLLRRLVGYAPWDYSRARFGIDGIVRLDYLLLWAAYGLGLERLHDLLVDASSVETRRRREKAEQALVLTLQGERTMFQAGRRIAPSPGPGSQP